MGGGIVLPICDFSAFQEFFEFFSGFQVSIESQVTCVRVYLLPTGYEVSRRDQLIGFQHRSLHSAMARKVWCNLGG